jgi:hypothetical protein
MGSHSGGNSSYGSQTAGINLEAQARPRGPGSPWKPMAPLEIAAQCRARAAQLRKEAAKEEACAKKLETEERELTAEYGPSS